MANPVVTAVPWPTITIRLRPDLTQPQLAIAHMPDGWVGAHKGLCRALEAVAAEMVQQAQGQQRVQVVQQMPGG